MRLLVTGAAGFLGSHVCERLLAEDHTVVGMNDFLLDDPSNLADLVGAKGFEFVSHDVSNFAYIDGRLDGILHCANAGQIAQYLRRPLKTLRQIVFSTHTTLELARLKEARYLLVSSGEVYGTPEVEVQSERYAGSVDPVSPRGIYAESKRVSESFSAAYRAHHGSDVRIARIFNIYGPRMDAEGGSALANFVLQALREEPLTVYGDGTQVRSFCYIDDIVEGVVRLFFSDHLEPMNLGSSEGIRIIDLARLVIEITDSTSKIVHLPLPVGDPKVRVPDITRARRILAWESTVKLRDGLQATIAYLRTKANHGAVASTPLSITGFL